MSDWSQELGGYSSDDACRSCGRATRRLTHDGLGMSCCGHSPMEPRPYTLPESVAQRCALKLAGEKLRAYRALLVMAIQRSVMYTHRLDDRASEEAAGYAYKHARTAAHNAFVLKPSLCPRPVQQVAA